MIKKILCLNFVLIQFSVFAGMQNDSLNNKNASNELSSENILPKPKIGLGTGMFSYFGEISNKKFANPMVSRVAYDLGISEDITDFLNLRFYVLFGKLDDTTSAEF